MGQLTGNVASYVLHGYQGPHFKSDQGNGEMITSTILSGLTHPCHNFNDNLVEPPLKLHNYIK